MNREAWLTRAIDELRPTFDGIGHGIPEAVAVSVGWPSRGALSSNRRVVGQCWHGDATDDGAPAVFVSPILADVVEVLAVLVHELIHAGGAQGHGSAFTRPMKALGLSGKPTATEAGDMRPALVELADELGPYPHAAVVPGDGAKKQSTRMLKLVCPCCGYVARTTRKWLDELGAPYCPLMTHMEEAS